MLSLGSAVSRRAGLELQQVWEVGERQCHAILVTAVRARCAEARPAVLLKKKKLAKFIQ